ncbi:MAG: PTS sugar transporter subunit IIA [Lentisphaeraceae bacterium]|nr:PTS sugar transporter subunit IIA [Lentisphaeraceae bacterium]
MMDISRLLPANHVLVNLDCTTRHEAIAQLIKPLIDTGIITDEDEFALDVENREQQITTVIGSGVALPHARTKGASRLGLTVGLMAEGKTLNFSDDPEVEPVNLIFMLAIPAFAPASHLPLLQHIAKFVRYEKKVAKLLKSKTPAAAAKYLISFNSK